ncbi:unnamed protein product [Fusarium graminearum]|uniref:Uncharacterized protein n=1 Tax=Gibberella zeae TaxID=5518 RepID=A0A2H3GJU1_GIBZA|nr:hypothetical protein HG531_000657 [Fusarium graminearum]PCD27958.1 hypothetical protein FGRA07_03097 [Fusarium graminearum]CAF3540654.1 unnamed protein product [Fusarium graminearum]CAG1986083.1 unnamed protein product [Fusarium graminearum]CAG1998539.1 unnamed protein product [Fusarium graminearum]
MKFLSSLLTVPALVAGRYLSDEVSSGTSTHYGGNVGGGACGLVAYTIPSGIYGTAFSGPNWDTAGVCGNCIEVTGPTGKKIKAMIVDRCNECNKGHLDLFEDAFTAVGGTSPYWFSMQVRNSNLPIKSLEVSTDNGKSWIGTTRKEYNFFENPSGFRTDTVDVRVTSSTGSTIIVKGVSVKPQTEFKAASNFP